MSIFERHCIRTGITCRAGSSLRPETKTRRDANATHGAPTKYVLKTPDRDQVYGEEPAESGRISRYPTHGKQ
jgi:hypothetical protein